MSDNILSIDAGTTNIMAMIVGPDGRVVGKASKRLRLICPSPGLVEQDPEEIWSTSMATIKEALALAGVSPSDLAAAGITGQRSTVILWDRGSGRSLGPAISWQDQRGVERAEELLNHGFIFVNPATAASKLEGAIKSIESAPELMGKGNLAWGSVDSFLVWRLSGGTVHATDCSNACTTGYFDYFTEWRWDEKLLDFQGLNPSMFPAIVDTSGIIGHTSAKVMGAGIPIGSIIGDQQSAAYAQSCLEPGEGKVTYGTSGTCNVNTGNEIKLTKGTYPLVLWRRGDERKYCLEGMVITAGAVFDWLTGIGLLSSVDLSADMAKSVPDSHGVAFLPALQGLGTPHRDPERHGLLQGLTLGVRAPHIVRAVMEGVAFRVREMLDGLYLDSGLPRPETLLVDGGAAANDSLMQIQANILGYPVERMSPNEATVFGAALLAGEACGLWEPCSNRNMHSVDKVFEPTWSDSEREERFASWRSACGI